MAQKSADTAGGHGERKMFMAKELEKNYNPADIEKRTYDKWQERKYFSEATFHAKLLRRPYSLRTALSARFVHVLLFVIELCNLGFCRFY